LQKKQKISQWPLPDNALKIVAWRGKRRSSRSGMTWSRPFDDLIPAPKGKPLITLKDAATYILALPKKEEERSGHG